MEYKCDGKTVSCDAYDNLKTENKALTQRIEFLEEQETNLTAQVQFAAQRIKELEAQIDGAHAIGFREGVMVERDRIAKGIAALDKGE